MNITISPKLNRSSFLTFLQRSKELEINTTSFSRSITAFSEAENNVYLKKSTASKVINVIEP